MPLIVIGYIGFWLVLIVGWVLNVVKIIGAISEPIDPMFIIRCIGTFVAPLGAILGYI